MRNTVTQSRPLGSIQSDSNPVKFYEIRLGGDGVVYCSCTAWKINKYCKHLDRWHNKIAAEHNGPPQSNHVKATGIVRQSQDLKNDEVVLEFFESRIRQHQFNFHGICDECGCSQYAVTELNLKCNKIEGKSFEEIINYGIMKGEW